MAYSPKSIVYTKTTKALDDASSLIVKSLQSRLEENNSIASGKLGQSISLSVKSTQSKIEYSILMLPYWKTLNYGTDPHVIFPLDNIKIWLTYPNVKDKLGLNGASVSEANTAAYFISRKIWDKGTDGNNFASDVFDSKMITKDLPEAILNAVVEDADSVLTELLDSFS
mgnify:FL=1|tara:strand:- start:3864 stop:4370 length:507 start_codon:yes stop_codon:yes gene_type:complete